MDSSEPTTTELLSRADRTELRTALAALIVTHPELEDQARGLLRDRPSPMTGGIVTVAPLQALRAGWLYQDPDNRVWYRIVKIDPGAATPDASFREALLENVFGAQGADTAPGRIYRGDKLFTVKIPAGRL